MEGISMSSSVAFSNAAVRYLDCGLMHDAEWSRLKYLPSKCLFYWQNELEPEAIVQQEPHIIETVHQIGCITSNKF